MITDSISLHMHLQRAQEHLAEAAQLREDVPHPVRLLAPGAHFRQRAFVAALLGIHEALEVVGVGGGHWLGLLLRVLETNRRSV